MAEPPRSASGGGANDEGTELLLVELGDRERSWRLNFDGFRPSEPREKPPTRGLHDCLGVLGSFAQSISFSSDHPSSLMVLSLVGIRSSFFRHPP